MAKMTKLITIDHKETNDMPESLGFTDMQLAIMMSDFNSFIMNTTKSESITGAVIEALEKDVITMEFVIYLAASSWKEHIKKARRLHDMFLGLDSFLSDLTPPTGEKDED